MKIYGYQKIRKLPVSEFTKAGGIEIKEASLALTKSKVSKVIEFLQFVKDNYDKRDHFHFNDFANDNGADLIIVKPNKRRR